MVVPAVPIAIGVALVTPIDSGNVDAIMHKVGFDHPKTYKEIHEGSGPQEMTRAADALKGVIKEHFGKAQELLETANREANVAWQGQAAEQFGNSTKPMTSFLTNAQTTSQSAGDSVDRQVEGFLTVRNAMPEPKPVDATDNLLEKGGAWLVGSETDLQKQEREATEAAEAAKHTYDTYDNTIQAEVQNPPRFDPPPTQNGPGGQGSFDRSGAINSPMGVGGGGNPGSYGGGQGIGGVGSGSGFGPGGSTVPDAPSGSGSSWAPGSASPLPAFNPGGPGAGGVGAGGGAGAGGMGLGMVPGIGGGSGGAAGGAGAGGRAGVGGAGAGAGANQPGAGGRAGVGAPGAGAGAGGAAGAGAKGAAGRGGMGGMGAGAGRGAKGAGDEDQEHESWLEEQDDVWLNDMPRTAPPVFGE